MEVFFTAERVRISRSYSGDAPPEIQTEVVWSLTKRPETRLRGCAIGCAEAVRILIGVDILVEIEFLSRLKPMLQSGIEEKLLTLDVANPPNQTQHSSNLPSPFHSPLPPAS